MLIQTLSSSAAAEIITNYDSKSDSDFADLKNMWESFEIIDSDKLSEEYSNLRKELVDTYKLALDNNESDWNIDVNIGLKVWKFLKENAGFTFKDANNDDIWRYISVVVIPDLTYQRYPEPAKGDIRINKKRFYSHTKRIWIKTLWLFIYFSWQGDEDSTKKVLQRLKIDNINKLIETPGKGYRVNLYRQMLKTYAESEKKLRTKDFAAMTQLNNVKCNVLEPSLVSGGEKQYAEDLLKEVLAGRDQEKIKVKIKR